jgi:potassium/hydrogen antiporter
MAGVPELFVIMGATLFLGFIGNYIFERTKISDVLILFGVGLLLGPIFGIADPAFFRELIPIFASLALIVILFDGGMNLNFFKAMRELSRASAITLISFILTVVFVGAVLHFVFDWNLLIGLLMGAVVGGTSSAIVIPILAKVKGSEHVKTILQLESALTDALVVVIAISLIEVIVAGSFSPTNAANTLFGSFSIAAVVGAIAGIAWIKILKRFSEQSYGYLLTIAMLFMLYGFIELIGGNGAIAALVFGLIVGNGKDIAHMLNMEGVFVLPLSFKKFQQELSFFVRTFFFVYIGLIFSIGTITMSVIILTLVVLIALVIARILAVNAINRKVKDAQGQMDKDLMKIMMPRGLAAAVLATLPLSAGILPSQFPEMAIFPEIVLFMVLLTNLFTTAAIFWYERKYAIPKAAEKKVESTAPVPEEENGKPSRVPKPSKKDTKPLK